MLPFLVQGIFFPSVHFNVTVTGRRPLENESGGGEREDMSSESRRGKGL